jgi:succinate dehydrogenase / fumarate reductase cytochrome b subunit
MPNAESYLKWCQFFRQMPVMQGFAAVVSQVATMSSQERPLSPHLQIYRPQLTSVLSILHRLTGLALAAGTILLVYLLIAIAAGPGDYRTAQTIVGSLPGRLLLFGWSWALFFHLCNGVRHLVWDTGRGFGLRSVYASGWVAVIAATALTVVAWFAGYASMGAI